MVNCSGSLLWPNTVPCGMHGECILDVCICQDHYTNIGDFSIRPDNSCDLNREAIIVLWALTLLAALFNLVVASWALWSTRKHLEIKSWRGWSMSLLLGVQSSIVIACAVLKFISMENFSIGLNLAITLLHGSFICVTGAHLLTALLGYIRAYELSKLARFGVEQQKKIKTSIRCINFGILLIFLFVVPVSLLPLILLNNPEAVQIVIPLHGMPIGILFLVLGAYVAPYLMRSMARTIDFSTRAEASKNQTLQRIAYKLDVAKGVAMVGFPCATVILVLLSFWPYLTQKSAYIMPALYCSALLATGLAVWVTLTTEENDIRRPSLPFLSRIFKNDSPDMILLKRGGIVADLDMPSNVQEEFSHIDATHTEQSKINGNFTEFSKGGQVYIPRHSREGNSEDR